MLMCSSVGNSVLIVYKNHYQPNSMWVCQLKPNVLEDHRQLGGTASMILIQRRNNLVGNADV